MQTLHFGKINCKLQPRKAEISKYKSTLQLLLHFAFTGWRRGIYPSSHLWTAHKLTRSAESPVYSDQNPRSLQFGFAAPTLLLCTHRKCIYKMASTHFSLRGELSPFFRQNFPLPTAHWWNIQNSRSALFTLVQKGLCANHYFHFWVFESTMTKRKNVKQMEFWDHFRADFIAQSHGCRPEVENPPHEVNNNETFCVSMCVSMALARLKWNVVLCPDVK